MKCEHGLEIGAQGGVALEDIASSNGDEYDEMHLLAFYSACDCCDALMHHNSCGVGYMVMDDGRTLCMDCATPAAHQPTPGEQKS